MNSIAPQILNILYVTKLRHKYYRFQRRSQGSEEHREEDSSTNELRMRRN